MKILVIGLGSMGNRRIRLIFENYKNVELVGVDQDKKRQKEINNKWNSIQTYDSIEEAFQKEKDFRCAFICTSPLSHAGIIEVCLEKGLHIFSELNLVSKSYEKNIDLARKKGLVLFLSSTLLYRKEINFIIEEMRCNSNLTSIYNYHVGQYLPDWHPWEDYKKFFAADKKSSACRELFAIEFPWLIEAFGDIDTISVDKGRMTTLDIEYCDYYMLRICHKNGNIGNVIVDIISREAVRKLEVFNEYLYIEWNGEPNSLRKKNLQTGRLELVNLYEKVDKLSDYSSNIIENQYLDEIKEFFSILEGKKEARYSFEKDLEVLRRIDSFE